MREPELTEERLRFTQALVAVLVIGGFVFGAGWMAPVIAALVVAAMVLGPRGDFLARPFDLWLVDRVRGRTALSETAGRTVQCSTAALLGVATLVAGAGAASVGDIISLVAGGIAALYATTGIIALNSVRGMKASGASGRDSRTTRRPPRRPRR